jgi:hypothetical protein
MSKMLQTELVRHNEACICAVYLSDAQIKEGGTEPVTRKGKTRNA